MEPPTTYPAGARLRTWAGLALVGVAAVAGAAVRLWIMDAPVGAFDSDSAVPGLMARHLLDGEFSTFYWGQAYGGPVETWVAALLFLVFGSSAFIVKLVPVLFHAAAIVLVWRVGRRTVGEPAARIGAVLLWVWPVSFLWWSTKVGGSYHAGLFLSLLALLLLLRLVQGERPWRWVDVGLLGAVSGLAFWSNVQAVYILLPAVLWYAASFWREWRRLPVLVGGFVLGAAPWIRYNALYDWQSLRPPPAIAGSTYWSRFDDFFEIVLPQALGLRLPFFHTWVGDDIGRTLYRVVPALFAVVVVRAAWRRAPGLGLLVLTVVLYPFAYAASTYSWYIGHPRYLLFLTPAIGLLLGWLVASVPLQPLPALAVVGAAAVSSTVALGPMNEGPVTLPAAPDAAQPVRFDDLTELLRDTGIRYAFADYWIAFRATFEAEERTVVTSFYVARHAGLNAQVRNSANPAYVFLAASRTRLRFEERATALGVGYRTHARGEFAVLEPLRKLLPEELGFDWINPG